MKYFSLSTPAQFEDYPFELIIASTTNEGMRRFRELRDKLFAVTMDSYVPGDITTEELVREMCRNLPELPLNCNLHRKRST